MPVAYVLAGPLADGVFKPSLASGGAISGLGTCLGARDSRGIALMFVVMGLLQIVAMAVAVVAWRRRFGRPEPGTIGRGASTASLDATLGDATRFPFDRT